MLLQEKEKKRRPKGRSGSSEEVAGAYFTSERPGQQLPAGPPEKDEASPPRLKDSPPLQP